MVGAHFTVRIPGVLIHAAVIDTILRTSFITEAGMNVTVFVNAANDLYLCRIISLDRHLEKVRHSESNRYHRRTPFGLYLPASWLNRGITF